MGRNHLSIKASLLLCAVALFTTTTIAATTTTDTTGTTASAATTTNAQTTADASSTATLPGLSDTSTTAAGTTALPGLTTSTTHATVPKLSATGGTYSYAAPTVPPTSNAPFMKQSTLPAGTVFIAVGAILGAFGAAILIWRAVVACLLHRSVKRAALAQHMANDKMMIPGAPTAPFYKYADRESSASLGAAAAVGSVGRGVRRTQRGPIPSATPSQTNLFFSPTAGNTGSNANNRGSTFLPSGFYAAGQGAPPQGHNPSISLTNLRPESRGVGRVLDPSPPDSPGLTPRTDPVRRHHQMSTSSLNLNRPPSGRAPSTYLEDLLADQPDQFPPSGHMPNHSQAWNQSRDRF
jgi:hypothetical protein